MTYPNEIKAQALALAIQGYSAPRIKEQLALTCPDTPPSEASIKAWRAELALSGAEQDERIIDNARDIAVRAQRLIVDTLDLMGPDPKQLANLNMVAGTAIDKIINSRRTPSTSINIEQGIIVIQRQTTSIDVEASAIAHVADTDADADARSDVNEGFTPAHFHYQNDVAEASE